MKGVVLGLNVPIAPGVSVNLGHRRLALGCQGCLGLGAIEGDTVDTKVTVDSVANDDGISTAGSLDVEVLDGDVFAYGTLAAMMVVT